MFPSPRNSSQLQQNLSLRVAAIEEENAKETSRVFGELAVALESGAKRNVDQLMEQLMNAREEKERHLAAHSERVVGEAMESLSTEVRSCLSLFSLFT